MPSSYAAAPTWKIPALAAMLMMGLTSLAAGEEERTRKAMLAIGSEEFQESCAACHGADASGTGELPNKLTGELPNKLLKPRKDLTRLAEQNGGTFPFSGGCLMS